MLRNQIVGILAGSAIIGTLLAGGYSNDASAQDTLTLKFAHQFPANHYLWEHGGKVMADALEAESNGKVKFEVYPAAQLGKDIIAILRSGVADVAILIPSFHSENFPLSAVSELPGFYATACEGAEMFWKMVKSDGILYQKEYEKLDFRVLYAGMLAPNRIMTSKKKVASMEDLAGLKFMANGLARQKTVSSLGGVPVLVPGPEVYDSLSRGTIDGALYSYSSMPPYEMQNVLKFAVEGVSLGSGGSLVVISSRAWDALPADLREDLERSAAKAQKALCEWLDNEDSIVRSKIIAEDGFTATTLTADEQARWNERLASTAQDWATQMDNAGLDAGEVLDAFRNAAP